MEAALNYRPNDGSNYQWSNRLREGDEYFQDRMESEAEWNLSDAYRFRLDHDLRRYELLEDTNSDYDEHHLEPSLEARWNRDLTHTLRYEWTRRGYDDRDGTDSLDKKIGDFDQHRLSLDTWWTVIPSIDLSVTLEGEWRRYRRGQTGDYEFFLPDYRPISNFRRYGVSSNVDCELTRQLRLSASFYHSRETHEKYSSFDLEKSSFNFEVKYSFQNSRAETRRKSASLEFGL